MCKPLPPPFLPLPFLTHSYPPFPPSLTPSSLSLPFLTHSFLPSLTPSSCIVMILRTAGSSLQEARFGGNQFHSHSLLWEINCRAKMYFSCVRYRFVLCKLKPETIPLALLVSTITTCRFAFVFSFLDSTCSVLYYCMHALNPKYDLHTTL